MSLSVMSSLNYTNLLAAALSLSHGLEGAVPVEELEDCHELLELQHGLPEVLLEHEAVRTDTRPAIRLTPRSLHKWDISHR